MKKIVIQTENLDQKAYQIIKDMIENREIMPGQKIPQERLATELGISRTPLISALKFLEHEKLVETKPRRGFYVRLFGIEEMISIFEIREVLEGLSARRAAESISEKQKKELREFFKPFLNTIKIEDFLAYSQADRQFHNYIAEVGSKEFLTSILQTFNIITLAYQYPTQEGLVRDPNVTIEDHVMIVEAICSHDQDAAEQLMREHLSKTIVELKTYISNVKEVHKEVTS